MRLRRGRITSCPWCGIPASKLIATPTNYGRVLVRCWKCEWSRVLKAHRAPGGSS